jgi:hypothetical protein
MWSKTIRGQYFCILEIDIFVLIFTKLWLENGTEYLLLTKISISLLGTVLEVYHTVPITGLKKSGDYSHSKCGGGKSLHLHFKGMFLRLHLLQNQHV